jgi:hypothetical protein
MRRTILIHTAGGGGGGQINITINLQKFRRQEL